MNDNPVDLDKHRGMAAQRATNIRRVLAEVETNAKLLRDRRDVVEIQLLTVPAASVARSGGKGPLRSESLCGRIGSSRHTASRSGQRNFGGLCSPFR
jgi:hypothetical protein